MEPCPDITCAEDVPSDLAGLRKYFEPNFDAMLMDQTGNDNQGNPPGRLEHKYKEHVWGKPQWNSDSCTYNQANGYLGGKGMQMRHKEVQELKTMQPVAMTCATNKLCLKELTGALAYKWSKMEQDMMAQGHRSVAK